jgi:O-antigen/teichoic acid export membrane protein
MFIIKRFNLKKIFASREFVNLIIRGATILLKFLLSIVVVKELSISEFGVYGIFQSTVLIGTFIIGFEFYNYSHRELKSNKFSYDFNIQHQLLFHLITYLVAIPIIFLSINNNIIDSEYLVFFIFILIGEHLSQELYRILILQGKTIPATFTFFIRSGLWVGFMYLLWELEILEKKLNSLFLLWAISIFISIFISIYYINFSLSKKINFNWIIKGLKISVPFFIATVCYKFVQFSGRYFLNFYYSDSEVGVYTFFSSIANILFTFIQTVVIIEWFPKLLKAKNNGEEEFLLMLNNFKSRIINFSILGFILSLIGIYPLLLILEKEILFDNIESYIILLISIILYSISYIPHYALYLYNKDIKLLKVSVLSLLINLGFGFVLVPKYSVMGAAITQVISFLVFFILKLLFWKKEKKS